VVFCQTFIAFLISSLCTIYLVLLIFPAPAVQVPLAEKLSYAGAFSYSMFLTNFALTLISYPTQALAKSCKILPAMMGTLFVKEVSYHWLQYVSVVMITAGVLIFNLNGKASGADSWLGLAALFGSLLLDSLTGYYTEHIRRHYAPSSLQTMQFLSLYGSVLLLPVIIVTNFVIPSRTLFDYCVSFPDVLFDIGLFAGLSAAGQLFIFWGLQRFGAVTLTVVTTTRKFMTVIVSILWFNHSLSSTQLLCLLLVFSGTSLDFSVSHFSPKPHSS
jgi:solute carrier family 35 (UDP-galactose transporter), member B1